MTEDHDDGLVAISLDKQYPGTHAVRAVDFEVQPGEVVALLGENGAGKSTLAKMIAGVELPTRGSMTWRGQRYAPASPIAAHAAGIAMIHQELQLFPDLTVMENVLGGHLPMDKGGWVSRKEVSRQAEAALDRIGFPLRATLPVSTLSVAAQQQVEIARALARQAQLLILDEPTSALGGDETHKLFRCIRDLKEDGVAFVYVSHRLAEIAQIADRVFVMRDGQMVARHGTGQVSEDQLIAEMVGRTVTRVYPPPNEPREDVVLEVDSLSGRRFSNVSFEVHAGEVFGIAGIVGAGRTELVRAVTGIDRYVSGAVKLCGQALPKGSIQRSIQGGMVMIPEDRKRQGVIVPMTIQNNIALSSLDRLASKLGWVWPKAVTSTAVEAIRQFGVKGQARDSVRSLSGGNQQKLVLGKWLVRQPSIVVLDEPTRGIDVGARASIYELIGQLSREGVALVVVSSDLEEVLGLANRVMVLSRGVSRGILSREEATPESVMALATQ